MKSAKKKGWGFDTTSIDKTIRPQDDFYHYANGAWMKKTKIPAEEAQWGSFYTLRFDTEEKLKLIIDKVLQKKHPKGSPEQMVADYYRAAIDMPRRNKLGITPLGALRAKIASIQTKEELVRTVAYLHKEGVSGIWNFFIDQDSKQSTRYIVHLWQGGLGLPEREYYIKDETEQKRVRDAYIVHIDKLLALAGFSKANRMHSQEVVMRIETRLARASMSKEDVRDPEKTYHKLSPSAFWKDYFARIGIKHLEKIIVGQPDFFAEVATMLDDVSLEDWKIYLEWHLINDYAGSLSERFVKENFRFYSQVMYGVKKMRPLWRRALKATDGALGEPLGKLYIQAYFPQDSKRKIDALVSDLFDVYETRIKSLDWMSPATKKKAVKKLRAISRKIGYPKKWDLYKGVDIRPDDYLGNIQRIHEHAYKKSLKKLQKTVDRDEWFMPPQMVNAYCSQTLNDIAFPAAILQWPFFDPEADDALNYAGIGSVIGHEMTHAFDDNGAKFDISGNMKNWWSPSDKKKFEEKGKIIVEQAGTHEVLPGIHLSGQLTLGENIADLGGLVIAWDAYQKHLEKTGRKDIDGLSPQQRFFLAFAQMERAIYRPEILKMRALTDPHSHAPFRINGPLANFEPFYQTFEVQKGDKLWRDAEKRETIW